MNPRSTNAKKNVYDRRYAHLKYARQVKKSKAKSPSVNSNQSKLKTNISIRDFNNQIHELKQKIRNINKSHEREIDQLENEEIQLKSDLALMQIPSHVITFLNKFFCKEKEILEDRIDLGLIFFLFLFFFKKI